MAGSAVGEALAELTKLNAEREKATKQIRVWMLILIDSNEWQGMAPF